MAIQKDIKKVEENKPLPTVFKSELDLKVTLAGAYRKQIENYLGSPEKALEFLSGVVADIQRLPALLECTPVTLINSYIVMAQLRFMPSKVSGEAYVLPYKNHGQMEAQFQLGYQGIVTLLYRAGNRSVVAEIVRKNDIFRLINGSIHHEVDPLKTKEERGEAIGVYAIITTSLGGKVEKFMRAEEIISMAKKFSKSYFDYDYQTKKKTENVGKYTPWNEANDPELWMWRKTVLKQAAKLAPKNETLNLAIAEDNKDSIIQDRVDAAAKESSSLKMGALLEEGTDHDQTKNTDGIDPPAQGDTVEEIH